MLKNSDLIVLPEPLTEFRYEQATADPHDGLAIFGPFDADAPSHPANISYGLVGTSKGIDAFSLWSASMIRPVHPDDELNPRIWPTFPGFEAAFASKWPNQPTRRSVIDEKNLLDAALQKDPNKRAAGVVQLYLTAIERMCKSDDPLGVIVCVVPDIVHANCRPQSHVPNAIGHAVPARVRTQRASGQMDLFESYDPAIYRYSVDFRRQIKARSMKYGVPIQIIQESTISDTPELQRRRGLTPRSDRAWNLAVALYYKAGGKPWRLQSAREGVCYIGLAYRLKDPARASRSACCAAQMFLDSGDGVVFLGEYGPWYSPERRTFHLARGAAKRLLQGVLKTYNDLEGKPLREIFLHCRSAIDMDEFDGFREACPHGVRIVGVRVRQERFDVRMFREGAYPVLRGTFWQVSRRRGYLWASGFKPRLGTYDGWEVPAPLRIDIQQGDADVKQIASDIFGLTKLNYNACRLGDAEPVTIGFSDAVGEILVSNPTVEERSPKFKFYI